MHSLYLHTMAYLSGEVYSSVCLQGFVFKARLSNSRKAGFVYPDLNGLFPKLLRDVKRMGFRFTVEVLPKDYSPAPYWTELQERIRYGQVFNVYKVTYDLSVVSAMELYVAHTIFRDGYERPHIIQDMYDIKKNHPSWNLWTCYLLSSLKRPVVDGHSISSVLCVYPLFSTAKEFIKKAERHRGSFLQHNNWSGVVSFLWAQKEPFTFRPDCNGTNYHHFKSKSSFTKFVNSLMKEGVKA